MTTTDAIDTAAHEREVSETESRLGPAVRVAPYVVVWTVLLLPALRNMARGWRPLADDASIAIQAWNTFSLHPPLVGMGTGAASGTAGVQTTADPGPLQFWLLGPFVHLDPGQGALLGAAVLCAGVLSLGIYVLQKSAGSWASVIFALVIVDLAIVSPTPFLDPVWNSSFGLFWFLAFLAIAFAVALGNLKYLPVLIFVGSVTIDAHLLYLPAVVLVLPATLVCGWLQRRPQNFHWLWWSIGVGAACWIAPLGQQIFGSNPNGTRLLQNGDLFSSHTHTFGTLLGFHALARAASPSAVWATPRPILPIPAHNDVVNNGPLALTVLLLALAAVGFLAWRHRQIYVLSLSVITTASAIGLVVLYARVPSDYILSFTWINLAVWVVGICIWLTFGLAVVTWARVFIGAREGTQISPKTVQVVALCLLAAGTVVGTVVVAAPYGNRGYQLDFASMRRVQDMARIVEQEVPQGRVSLGVRYSGGNFFQYISDEHGVAYLLKTAGWVPGMPPQVSGLLNLPIYPASPFVVFNEHQESLLGFERYAHYQPDWIYAPHQP
jgi:hypothetical protein